MIGRSRIWLRGFAYSQLQEKLITQSLPYVHKYGWTDNAILAACNNLDLSPASQRIIKPFDMISFSMRAWNKAALRTIDDTNFEGLKRIRDKVHFAIKTRLALELEYIDTWNQAMAIGAHPDNISETSKAHIIQRTFFGSTVMKYGGDVGTLPPTITTTPKGFSLTLHMPVLNFIS